MISTLSLVGKQKILDPSKTQLSEAGVACHQGAVELCELLEVWSRTAESEGKSCCPGAPQAARATPGLYLLLDHNEL